MSLDSSNEPSSASQVKQGSKKCTICDKPRDVLVRCQIDDTNKWHFVCPGKCWTSVSGGEIDARGQRDQFPNYRYGGMWKNRHADGPLNAKKPKKKKKARQQPEQQSESQVDQLSVSEASSSIQDDD